MDREARHDQVELAEWSDVVAEVPFRHLHPGVAAEPVTSLFEHRRRRVDRNDFGDTRLRVEHERGEATVTTTEIRDPSRSGRQHLCEYRLARESRLELTDPPEVLVDMRRIVPCLAVGHSHMMPPVAATERIRISRQRHGAARAFFVRGNRGRGLQRTTNSGSSCS